MNKHYFLPVALSALVLGACSNEDLPGNPNMPEKQNTVLLKSLDVASQAGRITVNNPTRGPKAERLQLVAKIAPVETSDTAQKNWSATAIAVDGGKAYITWHSNHQATTAATAWGGAIDEINIPVAESDQWAFANIMVNEELKFNHVIVNASNLYLASTSSKNGAVVGRLPIGAGELEYINIPGSSANAVAADGADIVAVSGYSGAAVRFPSAFTAETEPTVIVAEAIDFGGKYIDGGYILRTDDAAAELLPVAGGQGVALDAALVSNEKSAESYNPTTGEWTTVEGDGAKHYGKHTMAVSGGYVYVAAGHNGLRSYAVGSGTAAWSNETYTTAVYADDQYVYAATGAGLRVYEKKESGNLELFAYEVKEYDNAGNAGTTEAGTEGHSANFIAIANGYIFVAYGQSGVYVFKLNPQGSEQPEPPVEEKVTLTLNIPAIESKQDKEVEKGENAEFTIPETTPEAPEGKEFAGWSKTEGGETPDYQPGQPITVTPENPDVTLYPVWTDKVVEYEYVLSFDIESDIPEMGMTGVAPESKNVKSTEESVEITLPGKDGFDREGFDFKGWCEVSTAYQEVSTKVYTESYTMTKDKLNVTLYPVWTIKQTVTPAPPVGGDDL